MPRVLAVLVVVLAVLAPARPGRDAGAAPVPPRVGYVGYTSPIVGAPYLRAFRDRLAELGLVDGRDVVIDERYAYGRYDRLETIARELLANGADVLVTPGPEPTMAAARATTQVPIVMLDVGDPVAYRMVASLERPGGNVTGVSSIFSNLAPVHLDLLRRAVPGVSRVAVLWNPANLAEQRLWTEKQTTARVFGLQLFTAPVTRLDELDAVLATALVQRPHALYSLGDPLILAERKRVTDFALRHRLATLFGLREFVDVGGLMAYGPNAPMLYRQAAGYVARILRGARAGDLPVEPPAGYELVINLRTARAIGVRIPDMVLSQADAVIE